MIDKIKSDTLTEGIRIEAVAQYVEGESSPKQSTYAYAYKIRITNHEDNWAKLISRYWLIINANGKEKEVEGPGVIGYTPEFEKGDNFEYTSWSPINTEWGTMEGYFVFERKDGTTFKAKINRFYLATTSVDTIKHL